MPNNIATDDDESLFAVSQRDREIKVLAECALAVVADRIVSLRRPTADLLERDLCNAVLHPNPGHVQVVLSRMTSLGIDAAEIFEAYLPAVCQMLGERWARDEITFVDVTNATYRLQEVARLYRRKYTSTEEAPATGMTAYKCVPAFENHCLGMFLAANELRRAGIWVQRAIGVHLDDIVAAIRKHDFDMIGISAGSYKSIAPLCTLVDKIRTALERPVRIVIGGNIVNCGLDVRQVTGADLATINVLDAAIYCGLVRCTASTGAS